MSKDTVTVIFDIICGAARQFSSIATDHEFALLNKGDTAEIFHSDKRWSATYTVTESRKFSVGTITHTLKMNNVRLTCVVNGHNKEWNAKLKDDYTVVCRWGKIGGTLQSKEFKFGTVSSSLQYINEKIEEKLKKGYL